VIFSWAIAGAAAYTSAATVNESAKLALDLTSFSLICRSFNRLDKSLAHGGGLIQMARSGFADVSPANFRYVSAVPRRDAPEFFYEIHSP
jgi:hypothetical protein